MIHIEIRYDERSADNIGMVEPIRCGKLFLGILPVSYTHLDVYKRQALQRAGAQQGSLTTLQRVGAQQGSLTALERAGALPLLLPSGSA